MVFFGPVWSLTAPGDFELSLYDNSFLKKLLLLNPTEKKEQHVCLE